MTVKRRRPTSILISEEHLASAIGNGGLADIGNVNGTSLADKRRERDTVLFRVMEPYPLRINRNRLDTLYSLTQPDTTAELTYFFHPDHLGSASWITDLSGQPVQHLQYKPFGGDYIDQQDPNTEYSERFRFTGKERDAETGYETVTENGITKKLHYLTSSTGLFAIFASYNNGGGAMHYTLKDHQGNLTATIHGNTVERLSYDPWGRRRNPVGFGYATVAEPVEATFDRGYTLHEHYDEFGLINMNGRMYDPFTSGFLSVDNYVQSPDYTQSFNRYAYCLNNPLKYTDPDGEFWNLIIGAAIGGIANLATNWGKIDTFGEGLAYFGIGAAAGALGAATGGAAAGAIKFGGFVSGAISGAVGGASSGMITGSGNAWMQGANFGQGLKAGAIAAGIGAGTGAVFGGLSRGIMDYRKGFDFWDGSKVINHEIGDVPISELYPNENLDLESYNQYTDAADARFRYRTKSVFGVEQGEGDLGIDLITTKTNKGYTLMTDGTYATAEGRGSLGYTYQTTAGYTEVHVSPYAAFHKSIAIFKATVGHELTHAYHYSIGLTVAPNGPSENAALMYSAKMYNDYGMTNLYNATVKSIQSVPHSSLYNVPKNYVFSLKW